MSTGEAINLGVGAILTLTMLAVLWYAWEARKQAINTGKSAEASEAMVAELREQRLSEERPVLILDITSQDHPHYEWNDSLQELIHKKTKEKASPWPLPDLTLRVHNAGRGPAINVEAMYFRNAADSFVAHHRGFLLAGESVELPITGFEFSLARGRGSVPWRLEVQDSIGGEVVPGAVVVRYADVHGRPWASILDSDWDLGGAPYLMALGHQFLQLENES